MRTNVNRQWVLATRPKGMVQETDFAYRETVIPTPQTGEFLVRNETISNRGRLRCQRW
jgi:NADPH-dependent curcumin reductase CurA